KCLASALDGGIARISIEGRSLLFYGKNQLFTVGQLAYFRDDRHLVPSPFKGVWPRHPGVEQAQCQRAAFAKTAPSVRFVVTVLATAALFVEVSPPVVDPARTAGSPPGRTRGSAGPRGNRRGRSSRARRR